MNRVVLDTDASCHIRKRLHYAETTLWMSCRGSESPVRGASRNIGVDCPTKPRVAEACKPASISRERTTLTVLNGTE